MERLLDRQNHPAGSAHGNGNGILPGFLHRRHLAGGPELLRYAGPHRHGLYVRLRKGERYEKIFTINYVDFIYDGEGGYWFGASRAGSAGQPNLAHVNAEGVQDYYTEDASFYGGDGVLVHNGMLFKGKARSTSTVGNFGVYTIGKDAEGKVFKVS